MKTAILLNFGNYLDSIDDVQEENFAGFNRPDKDAWPFLAQRAYEPELARFLRKYRRQLAGRFGQAAVEEVGLFETVEAEGPVAVVARAMPNADVQLLMGPGRLSGEHFSIWVTIVKAFGCRFLGSAKLWYVPAGRVQSFDALAFRDRVMCELNVAVTLDEALAAARSNPASLAATSSGPDKPTISISRGADRKYSISFSYNRKLVDFFSNKTGGITGITAYNPATKARETYSLELIEEILAKISELFPEYEVITDGVVEAQKEREERQELLRQPIPEVQALLAEGYTLRPYQNEMVRFLTERNGNVLIGDEMGLGKTLQSLAWAAAFGKKVLVVAPKNVRRTWCREAVKFFPTYFKPIELDSARLRAGKYESLEGFNIAAVTYESVGKFTALVLAAGFDTIIIDESHRIKNPKAKTTQAIMALAKRFKHRIPMTGTSIKNKKAELFNQLALVAPELFPNVAALRRSTIGETWNIIQKCYLARQKATVAKDLPPKATTVVKLDIDGLPDWDQNEGEDGLEEALETPFDVGQVSRLQHAIAIGKVDATVDFVKEILDGSDQKVLVFTVSKIAAEAIAAALGDLAILHHGQMTQDRREAAKDRFEAPGSPERVFVTTIQSCREGATLNAASAVVFNSLPWTAADVAQAEARCHRIGQTRFVNSYWVVAENNVFDNGVADIVMRKYVLHKMIVEGKQLSEAERTWMEKPVKMSDLAKVIGKKAA